MHSHVLLVAVLACLFPTLAGAAPPPEWRPTHALVLETSVPRARLPIVRNPLLHAWALGRFDPMVVPAAGDAFVAPDGTESTWRRIDADANGALNVPASGWALIPFETDEAYDALLETGPSSTIIVNGAPRAGDPYRLGLLEHPFRVRKGMNTLLFSLGRGAVRPVVRPAEAAVLLSRRDPTLPHVRVGQRADGWAGLVVLNAGPGVLVGAVARMTAADGSVTTRAMASIDPYSAMKIPFEIVGPAAEADAAYPVTFAITTPGGTVLSEQTFELPVRATDDWFVRTFRSKVDGSVQYYGMREAIGFEDGDPRGLVVSLHGAGVEASGQIPHYRPRDWAHVIATTNRRPFGFDHEDWGRIDMLEAIADVTERYAIDDDRVHLTGHSMGGHGTWYNGLADADRFASIGPSSGWATFWTYAGSQRIADDGGVGTILRRASNVSDTLLLLDNATKVGVYVLHAERDESVPVREARAMRSLLGAFHADWAYYERPGAGHWWGSPCLDWPPMLEFMRNHVRLEPRTVDVTLVDPHLPGLKARGARILQQRTVRAPSRLRAGWTTVEGRRVLRGTTENVAELALRIPEADEPTTVELDDTVLENVPAGRAQLIRQPGGWTLAGATAPERVKSVRHPSGFKGVFDHRAILVYATGGVTGETEWARTKARFDAETFRYRGNGRLVVMSDDDYLAMRPTDRAGRNVVLYGRADTNRAWRAVLPDDVPFDLRSGVVRIGTSTLRGDSFGLVLAYPGRDGVHVGVVGGTGPAGRRSTTALRFFLSGAHFPDWTICSPEILERGWTAVTGCGFFDSAWGYDAAQSAWRSP